MGNWAITLLVVASTHFSVQAQSPPTSEPQEQQVSGKLFALDGGEAELPAIRKRLADKGIEFHLFLNDQYQAVFKGGANLNGSGRNSASVDAFFTFDLGKLGVIDDAEVLLHAQSNWGAGINPRTGSLFQVNDDADGDLGLHVAQLWYRQHLLDRKLAIMVGFLDLQTLLDRNAFANAEDIQFMNQALDNNPLVPLNIGLGAALTFQPVDWYTLIVAAGDAQSVLYKPGFSTAFHDENWWAGYMEHALHVGLPSARGPLAGNYRFGLIYDPRPRSIFGERYVRLRGHDYGLYISADQMLFRESSDSEQGLGVFGRFAYRTGRTNQFARFWSAGVAYRGLLPNRDDDVVGFGYLMQHTSDIYREEINDDADRESVYELYYALQAFEQCVVTFDVQYLDNPGAAGEYGHAVVGGIRVRFSF